LVLLAAVRVALRLHLRLQGHQLALVQIVRLVVLLVVEVVEGAERSIEREIVLRPELVMHLEWALLLLHHLE